MVIFFFKQINTTITSIGNLTVSSEIKDKARVMLPITLHVAGFCLGTHSNYRLSCSLQSQRA